MSERRREFIERAAIALAASSKPRPHAHPDVKEPVWEERSPLECVSRASELWRAIENFEKGRRG